MSYNTPQEMTMAEKPLLTTENVAELLQVDVETVRRYIREGKLRAIKLGREYRVRREDFEEFLEERKTRNPS
jgi:excisionase family DNA binding protein